MLFFSPVCAGLDSCLQGPGKVPVEVNSFFSEGCVNSYLRPANISFPSVVAQNGVAFRQDAFSCYKNENWLCFLVKGFFHVFLPVEALLPEGSLPGWVSACWKAGMQKKKPWTSCISISMQDVIMHMGFAFWCVIRERSVCFKSMNESYLFFSNFYSVQLCFHATEHSPFVS